MIRVLAVIAALAILAPSLAAAPRQRQQEQHQTLPRDLDPQNTLLIDTTRGQIVIKLRADLAPNHVERIKQLARDGFYNNIPFHRVIEGFMAQTGDGQHFDGTGVSKYPNLAPEFSKVPFKRGVVGMSLRRNEPNSGNSQFFIMLKDTTAINGQYTVIGEVVSGMNVVDKLEKGEPVLKPDMMLKAEIAADVTASVKGQ